MIAKPKLIIFGFLWSASTAIAVGLGALITYARGTEHPIASIPIKVDYCYLFDHEDLFRGQPVETQAHYVQSLEGSGIGKEECPNDEAVFRITDENEPTVKAWGEDLKKDWYTAEFDMTFIGVIPSYPRYRTWIADARNHWRPTHHVPFIEIQRITNYKRTR